MSKRSVDIESFASDFVLLAWQHRPEGAHIVQAVGHLDEHHAYVAAHGEKQLAEVLGLCRSFVAKDTARDFCQTFYDFGDFLAELSLNVFYGLFGVFYHVV